MTKYLRDRHLPANERFDRRIALRANGCIEWLGHLTVGYGRIVVKGRRILAHRFAYERVRGPIPDGLVIDHLCRNAKCVNPDHLEVVTQEENMLRAPTSLPVLMAAKTHCVNGHEYTSKNTINRKVGGRTCRECKRISDRGYYRKNWRKWGVKSSRVAVVGEEAEVGS